jgi:hypothetical protein
MKVQNGVSLAPIKDGPELTRISLSLIAAANRARAERAGSFRMMRFDRDLSGAVVGATITDMMSGDDGDALGAGGRRVTSVSPWPTAGW